jgi:2-keto-4-pentenoate hydratase
MPLARDLARRQLRDHRSGNPGTYFGEGHAELSIDEAYAVQEEVARQRVAAGDTIVGFKIGCIGPKIFEQFGMRGPIRAVLYGSEVRRSGATVVARPRARLAIEGEIAVRLGDHGRIAEAFPVIELHHLVFRGPRKTLSELIANNGLNVGIIIPADGGRTATPGHATPSILSIEVNGIEIDRGPLWGMGGAEGAVSWLRAQLETRGISLERGDVVLTGTPLGIHPVAPGDRIRVTSEALGIVEASVVGEEYADRDDLLREDAGG